MKHGEIEQARVDKWSMVLSSGPFTLEIVRVGRAVFARWIPDDGPVIDVVVGEA